MNEILCPICKKKIEWTDKFPFRPFCSERCRIIDLGAWADGSYAIPDKEVDVDESSQNEPSMEEDTEKDQTEEGQEKGR